jgi:hypothetical protein
LRGINASSSLGRFGSATSHASPVARDVGGRLTGAPAPQPPPGGGLPRGVRRRGAPATGASCLEFDAPETLSPARRAACASSMAAPRRLFPWLADQGCDVHLVDASSGWSRKRAGATRTAAADRLADGWRRRSLPHTASGRRSWVGQQQLEEAVAASDRLGQWRLGVGAVAGAGEAEDLHQRVAESLQGLVDDRPGVDEGARHLAIGQHRNTTDRIDYFTTSYFHRPEDLRVELERAGFDAVQVLGIEGLGEWLPDFDERWEDPRLRHDLMDVARRLEAEPSMIGASAHLLGIGRKG